jgi:predicted acylesterase/phospholipase RssA
MTNNTDRSERPTPRPSDEDIRKVFPDLARALSKARPDGTGLRTLASEELVGHLRDSGHSDDACDWALRLGIEKGLLRPTTLQQSRRNNRGRNAVEPRTSLVEVPAVSGTDKLWEASQKSEWPKTSSDGGDTGSIVLALSGGGVRATLFQLGILVGLAHANRLKDVTGIVSVSGGSILAAHFARDWPTAVNDHDGFIKVAAALVQFFRSNPRDSVFVPWLWSRLLFCWWVHKLGRTARLERVYRHHFRGATLGDLATEDRPQLAIVATDSFKSERVAMMADCVKRFPLDHEDSADGPAEIVARGIYLSLAVAASSCFPPVFSRMRLRHDDLGLTWKEFKGTLRLNDGGVAGNRGIKVLLALQSSRAFNGATTYVCDATSVQSREPGDSTKTDIEMLGEVIGESEKELVRSKPTWRLLSILQREPEVWGLSFRAQTQLAGFRTDLDAPSWQEMHALILHGAAVANTRIAAGMATAATQDQIRDTVSRVLIGAGGPSELEIPSERDLRKSRKRPIGRLLAHLFLVLCVMASEFFIASKFLLAMFHQSTQTQPYKSLVISLEYQRSPLGQSFEANVIIPPYQPLALRGTGSVVCPIPNHVETIERIEISHCAGYLQEVLGPFEYRSSGVVIPMKRDEIDPLWPPRFMELAAGHLPLADVVLGKSPVDPTKVTFQYRNNTRKELALWVFSGWRYLKEVRQVQKSNEPGDVFDRPKSPWLYLTFPPQDKYQHFDFKETGETSTNGWCCFYVKDQDHDTEFYLGCHNLFADSRPVLDVTGNGTPDNPYEGQFTPANTFGETHERRKPLP